MTTYQINDYQTGEVIATIEMTAEQHAAYEAAAQEPQGTVKAGDLQGVISGDVDPDTTVWVD